MKTSNKYYLLVFCMVMLLASCKKDFLDKQPLDALSSQTFWKTASDAQLGLTGVYNSLRNGYYGYSKVYLDCLSDNAYHQFNYSDITNFGLGLYEPTSDFVANYWASSYQGISACNVFLQNVTGVDMDAAVKSEYMGEVKLIRAFYYFNLINHFGDVILYTTPPTIGNANVARTPKSQVLDTIYSDLDDAIASLPDEAYSGHVVKGTALALKAQVYLFNQQWADAATLANQVITSSKFSLYSDYQGLFFKKNQENNPEIMFATQYLAPNDEQGYYNGIDIEIGFYAAIDPYQEMVDSYEMTNGKMITDAGSGYDPAHQYANRDPRLHASIKGKDQIWYNPDGTIFLNSDPSPTTYQMIKYVDSTLIPIHYGDNDKEDESIIHLRYADVLLMYAEAKNEATGPDASVYAALDQVRARVSMPPVDQTKYNSQSTLRDFIRHERRIELAFEGHRYDDITRWQIADKVLPLVKNPGGITVKFDAHNYLWPIPQHELSIDKLLTQNPGY